MIWLVFLALFVVRCGCQIAPHSTGTNCAVKTKYGRCCVFPFYYLMKWYHSCTTVENNNKLWCATTTYYEGGEWGNCESTQSNEWPSGIYGLPKPKSGCPSGEKNGWYEGWRYQDMEDDDKNSSKRSSVSNGSHMNVTLIVDSKKDVNRTFCMKQITGTQTKYWPKGTYCIYKRGACPQSMNSGWVFWDDEDDMNKNSIGGFLPDGLYDTDTKIRYCCQTDGHWYDVIELPVSQPFYLLTSSSTDPPKCQMVKWAFSYLEYIAFDTEDNHNLDVERGEHVFRRDEKIYYCYYKDCRRTMTGPSESFTSYEAAVSEVDPRSQYCSWLITIAESCISLSFEELTIPSCNDTFLEIYDGSNDTAPLLGTYCGSNASAELVDISSSTNSLFIVSNSGSYGRNPKSTFSFKAQYNAEHLAGCHREVMESTGCIKSPKFDTPRCYPRHSNCSLLVTVNDAYLITLNFSSLKLLHNDVINIYDGDNENAPILTRYSRLNATGNIVSSSNSIFIILKYGESSSYQSMFAFDYASQPKPTEKIKMLHTTSTSVISTVSTQGPNRGSAKQNESNQTTYIIVAVVVGVAVVLILIAILIFLRRRKKNGDTPNSLHDLNPSYSWRKETSACVEDSVCYANPSLSQENVWIGNSRVCKEGGNPTYEPTEGPEPPALYASPDNTCERHVENQGHAAESENPLYDVGEVAISHVYEEPNSQQRNIVYDVPDVKA